ncbi:MAG: hypothetical protein HY906_06380 [Deltaproteobacteria bacterium]|nr:hypothetical protein [Deltaproteobacteria bacterium]
MKIRSSSLSGSTLLSGQGQGMPVGRLTSHPMTILLFGKKPPKLVDKRKHPKLKKGLARLEDMKEQVALLLGRQGKDFTLELCEGGNACISRDGQIAFGVDLLGAHQGDDDLLLAILGHELGHQPWTWPGGDLSKLTRAQLDQLYRDEEARADRFAGRVLAELGATPDAVEKFLLRHAKGFEQKQANDYYPAEVRVEMIRAAFNRRARALSARGTGRLLGGG